MPALLAEAEGVADRHPFDADLGEGLLDGFELRGLDQGDEHAHGWRSEWGTSRYHAFGWRARLFLDSPRAAEQRPGGGSDNQADSQQRQRAERAMPDRDLQKHREPNLRQANDGYASRRPSGKGLRQKKLADRSK